jgi:hypothetical protein
VYADSTLREVVREFARWDVLHARRADLREDEHRERSLPAPVRVLRRR